MNEHGDTQRWLYLLLCALFATLAVMNTLNPSVPRWVPLAGAAFSSGYLAAFLGERRPVGAAYWDLPRFGLLQLAVFATSLCVQLAIQQVVRD